VVPRKRLYRLPGLAGAINPIRSRFSDK
jgi:hypothetical protein